MTVLSSDEFNAIQKIASWLDAPKQDRLLDDLRKVGYVESFADSYRYKLHLKDYVRPPYKGQHTYNIDAILKDSDGAEVLLLVYADENDRLLEFEFMRLDGKGIVELNWNTLRLEWSKLA